MFVSFQINPVQRYGALFGKSDPRAPALLQMEDLQGPFKGMKNTPPPPTQEMATLTIKRPCKGVKEAIRPPTWGQVRQLTQKAEGVLATTSSAKTPENLFLAMPAVMACTSAVSTQNHVY